VVVKQGKISKMVGRSVFEIWGSCSSVPRGYIMSSYVTCFWKMSYQPESWKKKPH